MSESYEANIARLESFRLEIKKIVEKIKDVNNTAADIKDVEELDEKDLQLWEKSKEIFLAVQNLSSSSEVSELENIERQCTELQIAVDASIQDAKSQSRNSKVNFGRWLDNRNPMLFISVAIDELNSKVSEAIPSLQSSLQNMSKL